MDDEVWSGIVATIPDYDVVVASPPCNTWTRAVFQPDGPGPVRDRAHPWGLPTLRPGSSLWTKCQQGSVLVQRALEACERAQALLRTWLLEHPEDLGAAKTGVPASIWALQPTIDLMTSPDVVSVAVFQCGFGAETSKPTRFAGNLPGLTALGWPGWPRLSKVFSYLGPLPDQCRCGVRHRPLLGKTQQGTFRTAPSAAYPPLLCKALARGILETQVATPSVGVGDQSPPVEDSDDYEPSFGEAGEKRQDPEEINETQAEAAKIIQDATVALQNYIQKADGNSTNHTKESDSDGSEVDERSFPILRKGMGIRGYGQPMKFRGRDYIDGCGLCSPGRWPPERRNLEPSGVASHLRYSLLTLLYKSMDVKKVIYGLCCGHFKSSPFSDDIITQARQLLLKSLSLFHGTNLQSIETSEAEPVAVQALHDYLRLCNDPDFRIFGEGPGTFQTGLAVGVDKKMPRAAALYLAKSKTRNYSDSEQDNPPMDKDNYLSVKVNKDKIKEQFLVEEKMGAMMRMSEEEAKKKWPEDLVVAAVGAIEKDDSSFRVIHDGTHQVKVNPRIKVRDLCQNPGHRELKMNNEKSVGKGSSLGLVGDVKRAHRIPKTCEEDYKYQACTLNDRSEDGSRELWLNRVGTFGIVSAGYWWSRMGGGAGRGALYLAGQRWLMQLLYVDDFQWHATGPKAHETLLLVVFYYVVMGIPFSWKKFRGGLNMDYVGYWTCLDLRLVGLSEGRASWIRKWISRTLEAGKVHTGEFGQVLGRMAFGLNAIDLLKPLLGPCYAWSAATPKNYVLAIPPMVALVLRFLDRALEMGYRAEPMTEYDEFQIDSFRADAKAQGDLVVLGGFKTRQDGRLDLTPWFSETLDRKSTPWVYERGEPFRMIASLELLATLGCVRAFLPDLRSGATSTLTLPGITDNKSNSQLMARMSTTKFPLMVVLMELVAILLAKGTRLNLAWVPRDQNTEADALTNYDFEGFSESNRIRLDFTEANRGLVFGDLLDAGRTMFKDIEAQKAKATEKRGTSLDGRTSASNKTRKTLKPLEPW